MRFLGNRGGKICLYFRQMFWTFGRRSRDLGGWYSVTFVAFGLFWGDGDMGTALICMVLGMFVWTTFSAMKNRFRTDP
ncbi:MAG: hypothetical protein COY40_03950 [Alphaproteobacteria bacterium CG_4_10_14_0_8_um_filter_53_9]|nr:MAG: hypothetical protein COY40_03950 [Alphaproteobacteria bacterium CG_4_10_14_0_8_um_filter_53_9]